MISKIVIYKNGHFYDKQTNERFELLDDAELAITTQRKFVDKTISVGSFESIRTPLQLWEELENEKNKKNIRDYEKILLKGDILYVFMSINKSDKSNEKYLFKVILHEDLYVYIKSKWKEGRLWDCACSIVEESTNQLSYFEPIHGKSLNEVYKNTFVHFFGNNGNPACNAIDRFWLDHNKEESKIRKLMTLH